jgi:CheY-like chemotaxis protein
MGKILIIDDTPFWRDMAADALRLKGHEVVTASDGLDGLAMLRSKGADLIVLDVEMPQMAGFAFLEEIRRHADWKRLPVIMLTGDMRKEDVIRAKKLGAVDYLLKARFSPDDLSNRVQKRLKAAVLQEAGSPSMLHEGCKSDASSIKSASNELASLVPAAGRSTTPVSPQDVPTSIAHKALQDSCDIPTVLDRARSLLRVKQALSGRTLSGVVSQVISSAASPGVDMADLAGMIARDPVLSSRVLRAANSANYASARGVVSTLPDAVRNIGCAAVRNIAAAVGVFEAMPSSADGGGFNPIRCWQHSFAVAMLCSLFAPEPDRGPAYLIGLCHDLGEILFHSHFASEYGQVLEVHRATGKPLDELETAALGMTRGEMARAILQQLELPDAIRQPIEEYHAGGSAGRGGGVLVRVLRIADRYANGILLGSSLQCPVGPVTRADARAATGQDHPPRPDGVALRNEIFALSGVLSRLSPKEEADVMTAPYQRRDVRICLVKDPAFSSLDPMFAALESLANVVARETLPMTEELQGHHALVVVARSASAAGFTWPELAKITARSGAPAMPMLWLVPRIDGVSSTASPSLWPVALSKLAEFVAAI